MQLRVLKSTIFGAICLVLVSCSYLFPKRFENFHSVEELENLGASQSQSENELAKKSAPQVPSSKTSKLESVNNSQEKPLRKPQADKKTVNKLTKKEVTTSSKTDLNYRTLIEIALESPSSEVHINTPQAISIHYNNKKQKRRDGKLSLIACDKQICINGSFPNITLSDSIVIQPKFDFLEFKKNPYRGVFVVKNISGKLVLINQLEMEDYLKGVLPYEIGILGDWAFEALKAQAVAARTYTYNYLNRRRKKGFDLYADVRDQMYLGVNKEYALSNEAVAETEDLIMTYKNIPIEAYYHSTCGGYTADVSKVWPSQTIEYLQSRSDLDSNGNAWCQSSSLYEWKYQFTSKEWNNNLQKNAQKSSKKIKSTIASPVLKIQSRSDEGRIHKAIIRHTKGTAQIPGDKVRWLFDPPGKRMSILPSSWVDFSHSNGTWHLDGKGFGHGIGLCQMGARERSRAGQTFREILSSYYTSIEFQKIK